MTKLYSTLLVLSIIVGCASEIGPSDTYDSGASIDDEDAGTDAPRLQTGDLVDIIETWTQDYSLLYDCDCCAVFDYVYYPSFPVDSICSIGSISAEIRSEDLLEEGQPYSHYECSCIPVIVEDNKYVYCEVSGVDGEHE